MCSTCIPGIISCDDCVAKPEDISRMIAETRLILQVRELFEANVNELGVWRTDWQVVPRRPVRSLGS